MIDSKKVTVRKELQLAIGISVLALFGFAFALLLKPQNSKPIVPHAANTEQPVRVTEFTSENVIKVIQYDLGEISVALKNQKNCLFKTTLSLAYETKKAEEAVKILQLNEPKIREYIDTFLSKQTPENLKNFSTQQNLEIDLVNGINKLLKQPVILVIYRKNSFLDCK